MPWTPNFKHVRGAGKMVDLVEKLAKKFPDKVIAALYKRSQIVLTKAKINCPVAPGGGQLRNSGRVDVERGRNGRFRSVEVIISFGNGPSRDYAVAVHEHLSEHSPPSWKIAEARGHGIKWTQPNTGPKFLEIPLLEARATLGADLASDLQFKDILEKS